MDALELLLEAPEHVVGGVAVRRALPTVRRRAVGPFVFLDQMGPARFAPGEGIAVGAHPHIGLSTLTFLFEGELLHRDSLRVVQPIRPGEVNWMTAGRGVAHSERTPPHLLASGSALFGIQTWVALPLDEEAREPSFEHLAAEQLPTWDAGGARWVLAAGHWGPRRSPARVWGELAELALFAPRGAEVPLEAHQEERALYLAAGRGALVHGGERVELAAGQLAVLRAGAEPLFSAAHDCRAVLVGGAPLDGRRTVHWNFVASSKNSIEAARRAWSAGAWPVPGEPLRLPLPER